MLKAQVQETKKERSACFGGGKGGEQSGPCLLPPQIPDHTIVQNASDAIQA